MAGRTVDEETEAISVEDSSSKVVQGIVSMKVVTKLSIVVFV